MATATSQKLVHTLYNICDDAHLAVPQEAKAGAVANSWACDNTNEQVAIAMLNNRSLSMACRQIAQQRLYSKQWL
jgi:hypothetical protein